MLHLRTGRLHLTAATAELVQAEREDPQRLEKRLAAHVPPTWPPPLKDSGSLAWSAAYLEEHPDAVGWVIWYLMHKEHGQMGLIGVAGFKGLPTPDGTVEIGYSIMPEYHRLGFAPEAVQALVQWAFENPAVLRVTALTLPTLRPSIRVLEKCGFALAGPGAEEGTIKYLLERPS
jgi:ribosomal-protein-alanine N-acetyltransferase